jgi:general secretion pathway protein J
MKQIDHSDTASQAGHAVLFFKPGGATFSANRQDHGFTLLEILIAIFLFSILATTLFFSYRTLLSNTDDFESGMIQYEMAQSCLARIANDLRSIHVALPPLYSKPGFNSPPGDYRLVGETAYTGNSEFGRLRFTSLAHFAPGDTNQSGIAEIRYYVHTGDNDKFVLRRSDNLYPYPPFEEKIADPTLCEDVKTLTFKYFDGSGVEYDTWNSDSEDFKYSTPLSIGVELEIGDDDSSLLFKTRITLPVIREGTD